MSFEQPLLLLTLLVVPLVIVVYLLAQRRRAKYAVKFTNMDVLASVVGTRRSWRRYVAPLVFLLALAALCVALARPQRSTLVASQQATVILVVDVSGSMHATDVKPTRLGAAQKAVRIFLDHAPKNLRVALIAFSGDANIAAPPTTDHDLIRQADDTLGDFTGNGGTAIGDALALAVEVAHAAVGPTGTPSSGQTIAYHPRGPQSPVSIVFLSDGHQTRGALQPLEGAAQAKAAGIPVFTVALGTPNGTLTLRKRLRQPVRRPRLRPRRLRRDDPGAARSGHSARDRLADGRQVRQRPERKDVERLLCQPRFPPGPQAREERDHERVGAPRRRPPPRRGASLGRLGAAAPVTRKPRRRRDEPTEPGLPLGCRSQPVGRSSPAPAQ